MTELVSTAISGVTKPRVKQHVDIVGAAVLYENFE